MRGEVVPSGTERITPQGYRIIKTEDGWKLKHRLVMEEKLGRPLKFNERVRFLDGDRTNCEEWNLDVMLTNAKRASRGLLIRINEIETELQDLKSQYMELTEAESA